MWMKTQQWFGNRRGILVIGRRDLLDAVSLELPPDEMEAKLRTLIDRHRPDLAGGVIEYMGFDPEFQAFEIVYAHDSIKPVPPGGCLCKQRLIPESGPTWLYCHKDDVDTARRILAATNQPDVIVDGAT